MSRVYYKIVRNDMHGPYAYNRGSTFKYVPRRWHKIDGFLKMCCNGFHVCTSLKNTKEWYDIMQDSSVVKANANELRVYECHIRGEYAKSSGDGNPEKIVTAEIRLLRLSPHFSHPKIKKP